MEMEHIRNTFLDLVQISSHSLHEGAVAAYCRARLEQLGFVVEEDDAGRQLGGETGNLIATLPGDPSKPCMMLAAHMDTVIPGEHVRPSVDEQGVVWSDGTTVLGADDKAGVTAILTAAAEMVNNHLPHGPLQVVFTIGEEIGLQGAKHLDRSKLKAEFGLSLDSGGALGTLVIAGPAQVKWEAIFTGKAAHAGVAPERGVSAIKMAAGGVARMPHGRVDAETTVNVGSFVGDGPTNIVPDRAQLVGEARSRSNEKLERVLADIEKAFEEAAHAAGGTVAFQATRMYDGFRFADGDPLRQRVEAALQKLGFTPAPVEGGGGSDANIYTSFGVPTMNIGIGYEDIHSVHEHIRLADIKSAAEVAVAFCTQD
ncbi:M20/M25/M40 family metallo-hydrolase [Alicyclobacillus cycloheptanicus]|uniref:Tripeptide aminopeptidase n=1 Tax=Alicyclobacillus cycloheptanicus TaxID=1457 RepID=A0ABT9XDP5_9BACL|nr:M20/M25/M40 family metallo-hydrolase [Alicyclobacillus cycloheptanicus]MDQ0188423.1 tripeptide aminopeptidase [Alicyclobacillus cycloheptanicus]WDM01125.1 M20/M25/M40 family metallo-hydrolase [Alicyclobacillus cycloheptanicus]